MSATITSVVCQPLSLPMSGPLTTSRHSYARWDGVVVRVTASDGAEGFGESREAVQITGETQASMTAAVNGRLAKAVDGLDPFDIETLHRRMADALAGNSAAKAALEMAVFDLAGRLAGLPVCALLGGAPGDPIPSSKAISVAPADGMVDEARREVGNGFGTLKIKTGVNEVAELEAIARIRDAVGPDVHLKLDANQGWTLPEATTFLAKAERFGIQMVEQPLPVWDMAGAAELRRRTPVPVMLDEAIKSPQDALRAIDMAAADYFNLKLLKTGGLRPALDIIALAQSAGIACQIGTLDTTIGSAAAVHLVHARGALRFAEINGPTRLAADIAQGFSVADGCAQVSPGPGLGIAVDPAALQEAAQ